MNAAWSPARRASSSSLELVPGCGSLPACDGWCEAKARDAFISTDMGAAGACRLAPPSAAWRLSAHSGTSSLSAIGCKPDPEGDEHRAEHGVEGAADRGAPEHVPGLGYRERVGREPD